MRITLAAILLLAACQRAETPSNQTAPEAPPAADPAPKAGADANAAERLVRRRIGGTGGIRFVGSRQGRRDGVPVVCGNYEQNGGRHRYIVAGEEAFIEPQMRAGEMDRAFREFCGDGERG